MAARVLMLAKNYEKYSSGDYHHDLVVAVNGHFDAKVYGPGYRGFSPNRTIGEVLAELRPFVPDLIMIMTSWDVDDSPTSVDPSPSIRLRETETPKVYFLNKEYKKLDLRLSYAADSEVSLIVTASEEKDSIQNSTEIPVFQSRFAVDLSKWPLERVPKRWNLFFTGSLHSGHFDHRVKLKRQLFRSTKIHFKSNLISKEVPGRGILRRKYKSQDIYWAEWGAVDNFGNSLVPTGDEYRELMAKAIAGANSPSADGLLNTRFFQQLAVGNLVFAPGPEDQYSGLLRNGETAILYRPDFSDFDEQLGRISSMDPEVEEIISNGRDFVVDHTYKSRIVRLETELRKLGVLQK